MLDSGIDNIDSIQLVASQMFDQPVGRWEAESEEAARKKASVVTEL